MSTTFNVYYSDELSFDSSTDWGLYSSPYKASDGSDVSIPVILAPGDVAWSWGALPRAGKSWVASWFTGSEPERERFRQMIVFIPPQINSEDVLKQGIELNAGEARVQATFKSPQKLIWPDKKEGLREMFKEFTTSGELAEFFDLLDKLAGIGSGSDTDAGGTSGDGGEAGGRGRRTSKTDVVEIQKMIGAAPDGVWGQETDGKLREWIAKQNAARKTAAPLTNLTDIVDKGWKAVASTITKVNDTDVNGFATTAAGLLAFMKQLAPEEAKSEPGKGTEGAPEDKTAADQAGGDEDEKKKPEGAAAAEPGAPKGQSASSLGVQMTRSVTAQGRSESGDSNPFQFENVYGLAAGGFALSNVPAILSKKAAGGADKFTLTAQGETPILIPIQIASGKTVELSETSRPLRLHWTRLLLEEDDTAAKTINGPATLYVPLKAISWTFDGNYKTYGGELPAIKKVSYETSATDDSVLKPLFPGVNIISADKAVNVGSKSGKLDAIGTAIVRYLVANNVELNPTGIPHGKTSSLVGAMNSFKTRSFTR